MGRVVPGGLDVPLALMAAGLAEGRTEEGERGGGEPENQREEAPAVPSTDTPTINTPTTTAARPAE